MNANNVLNNGSLPQQGTLTELKAGNSPRLTYDGSFNGFLTAVWHNRKQNRGAQASIQTQQANQASIFENNHFVLANQAIAQQLWYELEQKAKPSARMVYFAFLSEKTYLIQGLFQLLSRVDFQQTDIDPELYNELLRASQEVEKEKRKWEAQIELRKGNSNLWFAELNTRFNIIPLLSRQLKKRCAGSDWFLWDNRRKYGLLCSQGVCTFTKKRIHLRSALAS
jgi:probable DNA metabolism protein